jgi:hypothetical protein
LRAVHGNPVTERPALEIRCGDGINSTGKPRIAERIPHIHIGQHAKPAFAETPSTKPARTVPGTESLKRGERNPADISEAKAYANAAPESEETNHGRVIPVMSEPLARKPAPA